MVPGDVGPSTAHHDRKLAGGGDDTVAAGQGFSRNSIQLSLLRIMPWLRHEPIPFPEVALLTELRRQGVRLRSLGDGRLQIFTPQDTPNQRRLIKTHIQGLLVALEVERHRGTNGPH